MTGICYFSNKSTDYFAEMQVKAIAELDDSIALREEGDFSPEKADKLLAEAIEKDCNKIVFLTEDANVSELSRLIPQEYGQYFEDIQVVAENFYRINEAAPAPAANGNGNAPAQPEQQAQPTQVKGIGDRVIIVCDAAAPYEKGFDAFIRDKLNYESQATNQKVLNGQFKLNGTPEVECWLCNVDSAGLTAANIAALYKAHPNDMVKKAYANAKFSDDGYDADINGLVTMAMSSETVKKGFKYYFIVPKKKFVKSNNQLVQVLPLATDTYENPSNAQILPLIQELRQDLHSKKKDMSKRSDLEKDEEKYMEEFKKNEANVKFILAYIKCVEWWEKNKDKRLKSKEVSSELAKTIAKIAADPIVQTWNKLGSAGWGGSSVAAAKKLVTDVYGAAKKDIDNLKDKNEKDEQAENPNTKEAKAVFESAHYKDLCKLLGLKC